VAVVFEHVVKFTLLGLEPFEVLSAMPLGLLVFGRGRVMARPLGPQG